MRKSRFSEGQIIGVLREQESGATTTEVCRRHGISEQTFYRWKAKYGGMGPSDAQRLRSLEDENRRLKKLLAESMLDVAALKDLLAKMYGPPRLCKDQVRSDSSSLHKCIRPLASGLRLQPGHDEIRARRSRILARAWVARFFAQGLRRADRLSPHHSPEPRSLPNPCLRSGLRHAVRRWRPAWS